MGATLDSHSSTGLSYNVFTVLYGRRRWSISPVSKCLKNNIGVCIIALTCWVRGPIALTCWVRGPIALTCWVRGPIALTCWVRGPIALTCWVRGPIALTCWVRGPIALTCWVRGPIAQQVSVPTLTSSNLLSGSCGRCLVISQFYQKR